MAVTFKKYHGLGNDYLVYDCIKNSYELTPMRAKMICDRHFGVGSDGILVGPFFEEDGIHVKIYNPDGSMAEESGNGIRIFARYLKDNDYVQKKHFVLHTDRGPVEVTYLNENGSRLRASMGKLNFFSDEIPVTGPRREVVNEEMEFGGNTYKATCVSVGIPHCVIPMDEISREKICAIGKFSEDAPCFPNRMNTVIMQPIDEYNIAIEIHERGAGYTLASGSGSCAAAGVAYRLGLASNKMTVHMPGGELQVEIGEDGEVLMTGDVGYVGTTTLGYEFLAKLRVLD